MSREKDLNKFKQREWRRQLHPPPKLSKQNTIQSRSRRTLDEEFETENRICKSAKTDLQIVLVGKIGSGKSSAGNIILGQECFKTVSPESVTKTCERGEVKIHERNICVIDTPGLFDMTEEQMKAETMKCVDLSAPGPHVFLLVIRLDTGVTREEKNAVKWIQLNFGERAERYTIILFTHTDHLKGKTLEEFIRENNDLQILVDECGGRLHSFNCKDMKNRSQVTELMKKIEEMLENGGESYDDKNYKQDQKKNEQTQKTKQENNTNPEKIEDEVEATTQKNKAGEPPQDEEGVPQEDGGVTLQKDEGVTLQENDGATPQEDGRVTPQEEKNTNPEDEVEAATQTNRAEEPRLENKGVPQQENDLGVSSQEVGEVTQKDGGVSQEYERVKPPEDGGKVASVLGTAVKALLVALTTVAIVVGVSVAVGVAVGLSVAAGGGSSETIAGVGVATGVAAGVAVIVGIKQAWSSVMGIMAL